MMDVILDDLEIPTQEVRDKFEQPVSVQRDAKGNLVIVRGGEVVGTLQKAKSVSYEAGLESRFKQKRLDAMKKKQKQAV